MRNKKAISIALSAVMAFTTAFGMTTVKANAEEKEKIVVYVAAEGKNASGSAVEMGKTAVQLDEGAVAEDAIKIDTSEMTIEQVVEIIEALVNGLYYEEM